MKNLFFTLSLCFLFAAKSGFAQTLNEEKVPIKVSRVLIDIEEGKIIGVVNRTKQGDIIKAPSDKMGFRYTRDFRIGSSFYEENFKETLEKEFTKKGFDVEGWGSLFTETNKSIKPKLALAFRINDFQFNYAFSGLASFIDNFNSNMSIEMSILSMNSYTVVLKKSFLSKFYSEDIGPPLSKDDVNQFVIKALAQFVSELVADPDFKKAVEDAKAKSAYTTTYDKLTITKTAPKADRPAALKTALDGSVTVVTGGKYGSGVIISKDGLVLTCSHVVGGNDVTDVILSNQVRLKAKVLRNLPEYDAALLQLEGASANPLPIGNSTKAEIGEELWVIGTPSATELGQSVSKGILSGKRVMEEKSYLQTDASVSPGKSGGPLINQKGEIVGLVNAKVISRGTEGVGFAIPIDVVLDKLSLVIVE